MEIFFTGGYLNILDYLANMINNHSKKEEKDQESIQSRTTPDSGYQWEIKKNSQLDITNESQEVSPFPAGDHKASINRRARKHNKHRTEIT